jgi:hypothetical protein
MERQNTCYSYPPSILVLSCSSPTFTCLGHTWGWRKTRERIGSMYTTVGHNHKSSTRVKKVLVLIPTTESKFLAMWHGPYDIVERVDDVNCKVRQPGRKKTLQLYHVNLLKKLHCAQRGPGHSRTCSLSKFPWGKTSARPNKRSGYTTTGFFLLGTTGS